VNSKSEMEERVVQCKAMVEKIHQQWVSLQPEWDAIAKLPEDVKATKCVQDWIEDLGSRNKRISETQEMAVAALTDAEAALRERARVQDEAERADEKLLADMIAADSRKRVAPCTPSRAQREELQKWVTENYERIVSEGLIYEVIAAWAEHELGFYITDKVVEFEMGRCPGVKTTDWPRRPANSRRLLAEGKLIRENHGDHWDYLHVGCVYLCIQTFGVKLPRSLVEWLARRMGKKDSAVDWFCSQVHFGTTIGKAGQAKNLLQRQIEEFEEVLRGARMEVMNATAR
jgi:hypothetical protein